MIVNVKEIAAVTRKRVEQQKNLRPPGQVENMARSLCAVPPSLAALPSLPPPGMLGKPQPNSWFEEALAAPGLSFICEVRQAPLSKGLIAQDFPYLEIAKEYEEMGASAISVLTEPDFFMGSDDYLREIAERASIPVLRKDFVIDPYQIYEAKLLGASAVFLISALLDKETLKSFIKLTYSLGMAAVAGVRNERELDTVLEVGARVVGVKNRDPATLKVDIGLCLQMRSLVPGDLLFVVDSGVKSADDVKALTESGVDAVLIDDALMRSPDKKPHIEGLLRKSAAGRHKHPHLAPCT
jgi:indole-3-glycerol phosphate synthase